MKRFLCVWLTLAMVLTMIPIATGIAFATPLQLGYILNTNEILSSGGHIDLENANGKLIRCQPNINSTGFMYEPVELGLGSIGNYDSVTEDGYGNYSAVVGGATWKFMMVDGVFNHIVISGYEGEKAPYNGKYHIPVIKVKGEIVLFGDGEVLNGSGDGWVYDSTTSTLLFTDAEISFDEDISAIEYNCVIPVNIVFSGDNVFVPEDTSSMGIEIEGAEENVNITINEGASLTIGTITDTASWADEAAYADTMLGGINIACDATITNFGRLDIYAQMFGMAAKNLNIVNSGEVNVYALGNGSAPMCIFATGGVNVTGSGDANSFNMNSVNGGGIMAQTGATFTDVNVNIKSLYSGPIPQYVGIITTALNIDGTSDIEISSENIAINAQNKINVGGRSLLYVKAPEGIKTQNDLSVTNKALVIATATDGHAILAKNIYITENADVMATNISSSEASAASAIFAGYGDTPGDIIVNTDGMLYATSENCTAIGCYGQFSVISKKSMVLAKTNSPEPPYSECFGAMELYTTETDLNSYIKVTDGGNSELTLNFVREYSGYNCCTYQYASGTNANTVMLAADMFDVTFETNGGTAVTRQKVIIEEPAEEPENPTKENCEFVGWYADEACTEAYNFDTLVTEDITLYAKWKTVASAPVPASYFSYDAAQYNSVLEEATKLQAEIDKKKAKEVKEEKPEITEEITAEEAKAIAQAMVPTVRTENVARGIRVYVLDSEDVAKLKAAGYKVLYDFYRAEGKAVPKASDYKITKVVNKEEPWYLNTAAKKGQKYYYKAIAKVYDKDGNLVAETELAQGKYGVRTRK